MANKAKQREASKKWHRSFHGYLRHRYRDALARTKGKTNPSGKCYWNGLPIAERDDFLAWAAEQPDYIRLHQQWIENDYERKFSPEMHRRVDEDGYLLHNIQWVTATEHGKLTKEGANGSTTQS